MIIYDQRDKNGRFIKSRTLSPEMKRKISETEKGKYIPLEVRKKMGDSHKGEKAYNWKGGISKRKQDGRSFYGRTKKYIYRAIFEDFIGRKLKRREVIHHIDGDTENNHISNLFMFRTNGAHKKLEYFEKRHNIKVIVKTNYHLYAK